MTDALDAMMMARDDLVANMVPVPEDLLSEVGPLAKLYFAEQTAYEVLKHFAADLATFGAGDTDLEATVGKAMQGIATAAGALDEACIAMGILPSEAGEQTI